MQSFVGLLAAKYGMAETLKAALAQQGELRTQIRESLTDALRLLLAAGTATNALRSDIAASDVLLALGGIALIAGAADQTSQAQTLIGLLIDGLRYRAD